jgi:hypothetical protein
MAQTFGVLARVVIGYEGSRNCRLGVVSSHSDLFPDQKMCPALSPSSIAVLPELGRRDQFPRLKCRCKSLA